MNNLKISTRLIGLIGLMSILLTGLGLLGLFGISKSNDALQTVYVDRTEPMGQLADINRLLLRNRLAVANSMLDKTAQSVAGSVKQVEENITRINQIWDAYMATTLTVEEEKLAKKFAVDRARFVQEALLPLVAALRASDYEGADRIRKEKISQLFAPVREGVDALMQLQLDVAKQEYEAAVARYNVIRLVSIGSIIGGVLLSVLFGLALVRGISNSLNQAIQASNAVAQGDLTHRIQVQGKDEVSMLLQALKSMQDSLAQVVSRVRQGSESVSTASAEIASGNTDLSARTESQACALE